MNIINKEIFLPEGNFNVDLIQYDEKDRKIFYNIYKNWISLSTKLRSIGGRAINLPEGLSEGSFCLEMNCVKMTKSISGANTSWDCYDLNSKKRIQVKACSVLPDLTSFGPKSEWDEIYFLNFFKDGKWDGSFDIYKIDNDLIYSHKVNRNQTMKDQQKQGRRPRFSIYKDIIIPNGIKPVKTGDLKIV